MMAETPPGGWSAPTPATAAPGGGHRARVRRSAVHLRPDLTEGYLASVRALDNDGSAPAHVADPMMRQVYSEALDHVEAHPDRLRDAEGRPLEGDEPAAAREDLIRSGIERSMAMPRDGLGGQSPIDAFIDEYESVHPRGEDDHCPGPGAPGRRDGRERPPGPVASPPAVAYQVVHGHTSGLRRLAGRRLNG
jgi:hypothetical protein